jgi:hypothetical protein
MPPRGKIANNPAAGCGRGRHGASTGVRCGRVRGPRPVCTAPAMPPPRRPRPGWPPTPARLRRARPRARRRARARHVRAQARAEARKTGRRGTMACMDLCAFAVARRRARAGGNSVKRRFLSAVLGFHGCGLGWFSLAAFDDKLWPHLRIGRLKKQESETGSCQEPSRNSVLVRKRKVRTANAHRRQHGQHHASHRSDRRAYCSRWRLVRPGSLVLDPALRAPRLAKGWRRAPMRSNRVVEHGLADRLLQHELARRSHQEIRRSRCSGSPAGLRVPRYWRRRPTS